MLALAGDVQVGRLEGGDHVAAVPEIALPTRRRDVEAPPRLKVYPSGEDVDMDSLRRVLVAVEHRRPGVAVRVDPRPCDLLEAIERALDLVAGGLVLGRPRQHRGAVAVLVAAGVGDLGDLVRIAAQDLDLVALLAGVIAVGEKVGRRGRGAAGAVPDEAGDHRPVAFGRSAASSCSMSRSCARTSRASAASRWVFAHRASWFRLTPTRPTARASSRAAAESSAVQVRVRLIARRSRSETGTPARSAFARHSASSAGDTRHVAIAVRRCFCFRIWGGVGGACPTV